MNWTLWHAVLSAALGVLTAALVQGYVLAHVLPVRSRLLIVLTGLALALAIGAYFILLRWLHRVYSGISPQYRPLVYGVSLIVGTISFLGGTSQWATGNAYVPALLPQQNVELEASADSAPGSLSLTWFHTSLGDISYDDLVVSGWSRVGDTLVLSAPNRNSITWTGRAGARVQVVIESQQAGNRLHLTLGSQDETLLLRRGKNSIEKSFVVPFLASSLFLSLAGWLVFVALGGFLVVALSLSAGTWLPRLTGLGATPAKPAAIDGWVVGVIIALALALRVPNLGSLFPAVDEYYHLIAAKAILAGAPLSGVYPRGLWLVTLPVAAGMRLLGEQLWVARLVGALFNTAAILPLYLITRRINRAVALISCALFATSPWIVTFARVAREYAYYPFYFYAILLVMVMLVEAVPARLCIWLQWRTVLRPRVLLLVAALAVPPIFALRIDWLSTFRTILIAYVVLGAYLLTRFEWRAQQNWPVLGLVAVAIVLAGLGLIREQSSKLLALPRWNPVPVEYFLPNPPQQWYFDRVGPVATLCIVAAAVVAVTARGKLSAFLVGLWLTYLVVFAFFSRTFFHTRHLLSTQLWYIPVIALGGYGLWELLRALIPWKGSAVVTALAAALVLSTFNPQQVVLPAIWSKSDMPISEDYHHDMSTVQRYLLAHVEHEDVLISTIYGLYATWDGAPRFRTQYRITSNTPLDDILTLVSEYPSGWIVIDRIRLELSAIAPGDFNRIPQIEYIGTFGDEYVWRWNRGTADLLGEGAN